MLVSKQYTHFELFQPETNTTDVKWQGAEKTNRCLPGDKITYSPSEGIQLISRADHELVGVLHLTSKYMYGMTNRNVPLYLCEPFNKGYPSFRVACKEKDRTKNLLIQFTFESWDEDSQLPRGSIRQIFGPVEDFDAEKKALAYLSGPYSAPKPDYIPEFISGDRRILSKGTFNIDPLGCKDIDDVITIVQDGDLYHIAITIADVSEVVYPGTKVFQTAQKLGFTSYQNGVAVRPMLHPLLSENACSLLPGKRRYGLSLCFDWSFEKNMVSEPVFEETFVENQESYTYESIYESQTVPLEILASVVSCIAGRKVLDSHEWIEQLMIFYNIQAAKLLAKNGSGILRMHDKPLLEKCKVLQDIEPNLIYLAYKSAVYCSVKDSNHLHSGLGLELYCHASSPIRRFADLINQILIKSYLSKKTSEFTEQQLVHIIYTLNKRQKEIAAAERDFQFLQAITSAQTSEIEGIYLWNEKQKHVFYVPSWKTTIHLKEQKELEAGHTYRLKYYCNRQKAKWKERMCITYSE